MHDTGVWVRSGANDVVWLDLAAAAMATHTHNVASPQAVLDAQPSLQHHAVAADWRHFAWQRSGWRAASGRWREWCNAHCGVRKLRRRRPLAVSGTRGLRPRRRSNLGRVSCRSLRAPQGPASQSQRGGHPHVAPQVGTRIAAAAPSPRSSLRPCRSGRTAARWCTPSTAAPPRRRCPRGAKARTRAPASSIAPWLCPQRTGVAIGCAGGVARGEPVRTSTGRCCVAWQSHSKHPPRGGRWRRRRHAQGMLNKLSPPHRLPSSGHASRALHMSAELAHQPRASLRANSTLRSFKDAHEIGQHKPKGAPFE